MPEDVTSSTLLTLRNVDKSFGSESKVLSDISFSISRDERMGIVGESGSGKSVLLKLIGGVEEVDSGEISWSEGTRGTIGFLFQEGALFDSLSVEENVMFPLVAPRSGPIELFNSMSTADKAQSVPLLPMEEARLRAREMLGFVGLSKAGDKLPSELSGGMRKRAGIARALVHAPQILLLDDPTSGLDPITASTIMNLIERLAEERDCALVMVSHDIRRLLPRVDRVLMLSKGTLIADYKTNEIVTSAPREMVSFLETRFDFSNAG